MDFSPRLFLSAITNPKETFESEKPNATLQKAFIYLILGDGLGGFLVGLFSFFTNTPPFSLPIIGYFLTGSSVLYLTPILTLIISIPSFFIVQYAAYLAARFLKGTGSFSEQVYLVSLYTVPLALISSILGIAVPQSVLFTSLVAGFYSLYLLVLALKTTHGFDSVKAVICLIAPILVFVLTLFPMLLYVMTADLRYDIETFGLPKYREMPSPLPDLVLTSYQGDIRQIDNSTFEFEHNGMFIFNFELKPYTNLSGISCNIRTNGSEFWEGTFGRRTLYYIKRDGGIPPKQVTYNSSLSDLLSNAEVGDVFEIACYTEFYYPYFKSTDPNYHGPDNTHVNYTLIAK